MNILFKYSVLIAATLCYATKVDSFKILLLPIPAGSHLSWMVDLGIHLADRGHQVDMLLPDISLARKYDVKSKVNLLFFEVDDGDKFVHDVEKINKLLAQEAIDGKLTPIRALTQVWSMMDMSSNTGQQLFLNNKNVLDVIKKRNYDLGIVDGAPMNYWSYVIPYKYDFPYVSITTVYDPSVTGIPSLPSFVPIQGSTYSHEMSFAERLANTFLPGPGILSVVAPNYIVSKFAPEKPYLSLYEIQRRSQMFFLDIAPPVDYPRPTLPHVVIVPGMTVKPAKETKDEELLRFADEGKDGFILFSLGSYTASVPERISQVFVEAFRRIPQRVIWRYVGPELSNVPETVKLLSWIPQNDLLAHPNIKLFMTHCGNNGQYESLYHGVPMLGLPIFVDQPYNAKRMVSMGYGLSLHLSTITTEELIDTIRRLTEDEKFSKKAKLASRILKDDPMLPIEKVSFWVEHVIKFGSGHLRSPAVDMPWYQYWMVDVITFILCLTILFFFVLAFFMKLVCKNVRKLLRKDKME